MTPVGMGIFGSYLAGQEEQRRQRMAELQGLSTVVGLGGALQSQQQAAQMSPIQLEIAKAQLAQMQNPRPEYRTVGDTLLQIPSGGQPTPVFSAPQKPQLTSVGVEGQPGASQRAWATPQGYTPFGPPQLGAAAADRPYFQFLPTAQGFMTGNTRTGQVNPATVGGRPVIPATADPSVSYGKTAGADAAKQDVEQHATATSAQESLAKINELMTHIQSSDAITGLGADVLKNIERVKVFVANSEKAGRKVSDTELLDAMMGQEVFPQIKALGIGARGLDTPAEREFLRQVMSGTIQLNKDTLVRLTQMRRDIAQRAVDKWNQRVETGELDRFFESTGRIKQKLDAPSTPKRRSTDKGGWSIQRAD